VSNDASFYLRNNCCPLQKTILIVHGGTIDFGLSAKAVVGFPNEKTSADYTPAIRD